LRSLIGDLVRAVGREGGVVAPADVLILRVAAGNLLHLLEPTLGEVDGQRRVAEHLGLLLAFTQEIGREIREGQSLVFSEVTLHRGRDDHVGVGRERIRTRVAVAVDAPEVGSEVVGRLGIFVDHGGQQRNRHIGCRRLGVVAGGAEHLHHRESSVEGIGLLHVGDGADRLALGNETRDAVGSLLPDERRPGDHGVVGRDATVRLACFGAVRGPDRRVLRAHPTGQLCGRSRAVGPNYRNDRDTGQGEFGVVGGDRGVIPFGDHTGEDLCQDLPRQSQIRHALAADDEVVHEGRTTGHDRHVGELTDRARVGAVAAGELIGDLGHAEVDRALREQLATSRGAGVVEGDLPAVVVEDVADPLLQGVCRPGGSGPRDGVIGVAHRRIRARRDDDGWGDATHGHERDDHDSAQATANGRGRAGRGTAHASGSFLVGPEVSGSEESVAGCSGPGSEAGRAGGRFATLRIRWTAA